MTITGTYVNAKTKIGYICNDCKTYHESTPDALLRRNRWCRSCSKEKYYNGLLDEKATSFYERFSKVDDGSITLTSKFIDNKTKISYVCNLCGRESSALPYSLIKGYKCKECGHKRAASKRCGSHNEYVNKVKVVNPYIDILSEFTRNKDNIDAHCNICGYTWSTVAEYLLYCGCPACSHRTIIQGFNDIYSTRPDLHKYFNNIDDAKRVSIGSSIKVELKCPDCGYIKTGTISNLIKNGFACPQCSDYISYPNAFFRGFMLQTGLPLSDYRYEYTANWTKNYRYDGWFILNGQNYVVELDGLQHIQETSLTRKSLDEIQEADKCKDELAKSNNYIMIRIPCYYSNVEYISEQYRKSIFNDLFNLSVIDWNECDKQATKNIVKEVCEYHNLNPDKKVNEMADTFKLSKNTIKRYIAKGKKFGWCNNDISA